LSNLPILFTLKKNFFSRNSDLWEKLKPRVFGQSRVHVRQLSHRAQELNRFEIANRLEELVLASDQLVERGRRSGRRRLFVARFLLESVAAAVRRQFDFGELGVIVTVLNEK
jgi:hypothetical protein